MLFTNMPGIPEYAAARQSEEVKIKVFSAPVNKMPHIKRGTHVGGWKYGMQAPAGKTSITSCETHLIPPMENGYTTSWGILAP